MSIILLSALNFVKLHGTLSNGNDNNNNNIERNQKKYFVPMSSLLQTSSTTFIQQNNHKFSPTKNTELSISVFLLSWPFILEMPQAGLGYLAIVKDNKEHVLFQTGCVFCRPINRVKSLTELNAVISTIIHYYIASSLLDSPPHLSRKGRRNIYVHLRHCKTHSCGTNYYKFYQGKYDNRKATLSFT